MGSDTPTSGDTGKSAGENAQSSAALSELQKEVAALKSANRELERHLKTQDETVLSQDYLDFLASKDKGRTSQGEEKEEEVIDFDSMGGKQLVEHLTKAQKQALKQAREEVASELRSLAAAQARAEVQHDLDVCKLRHSDLESKLQKEDYLDTFYQKAKENPSWKAERVYREVERDLREAAEQQTVEERKRARAQLDAATERGGVPSSTSSPRELSAQEAAELAYRKAYGSKEE